MRPDVVAYKSLPVGLTPNPLPVILLLFDGVVFFPIGLRIGLFSISVSSVFTSVSRTIYQYVPLLTMLLAENTRGECRCTCRLLACCH